MEKYNLTPDSQELMTYFRQGVKSETKVLPSMVQVANANELTLQDRRHNLLDFVSRPIDVFKGTWTTAQSQNDELIPSGLIFPDLLYQNAQYQEKMRGFVGLRGSIKIRILFNAQKFQQGLLMAYWIPNYANLIGKAALIRASLAGKSGCAHVIMNCEGGTEQTIEIPYVNQHTFYNSVTNQGNYGALFLTCLSPLQSTIPGDFVGYRVQAWLEKPELEYPTAVLPVLTQGLEEDSMHENTAEPSNSGGNLTLDDVVTEMKNFKMKPSYIAKSAGNLLQLAGYQKPTNITGVCRSSLRTNSYMANFGGEQMAHKMALAANNELPPMPHAGGSTLDEMNIINICKAPTYYKSFQVSATNPENYVLFTDNVHPCKFVQTGTDGVMNSTFVGYVSSAFGQWRGSMKYIFVVAKTGFHSGTLRVTWVPGLYAPFPDPTAVPPLTNLDRCYQETYDLRDMNEFSFTVPYTSTREFLNVINPFSEGEQTVSNYNYSTGVLVVDVFVPIRAPEQMVQNFQVNVFVSGGDDLVFANPTAPNIYPYSINPISSVSDAVVDRKPSRKWHSVDTQGISFDEQHNRQQAIESSDELIGSARLKKQTDASAFCTGEFITSIKNLMARFGVFHQGRFGPITDTYTIAPFDFQIPLTSPTFNDPFAFDYIDYFSYLFGFYRGGVRITMDPGFDGFHDNTTTHVKMRSSLNTYYPTGDIPRASVGSSSGLSQQFKLYPFSTQIVKPSIEGTIDVEVPYYSLAHVTPVLVKEQTQEQVEESNYPFPILTFLQYGALTSPPVNYEPQFLRACADDFRFQYMLGPPQVHFTAYSTIPRDTGSQFHRVSYKDQPVTRSGNAANGFFGQSFTFDITPGSSILFTPNQFLATSPNNDFIYLMPENQYAFNWSTTGNLLQIVAPIPYNIPANSRVFSNNAELTSSSRNVAWTRYTVIAPTASNPQSLPEPCASIQAEAIQVVGSGSGATILIPTWSGTAYTNGQVFSLPVPVLLGRINTSRIAQSFVLLPTGTRVYFSISPSFMELVFADTNSEAGYIIQSLGSNTGFTNGSFSPTLVEEIDNN